MKKFLFFALALLLSFTPSQLDAKKVKFKNGDVYDGEWKNKAPNGIGLMMYANGEIYSGAWENGIRSGLGAMSFSNGNEYSGEWKDDLFHGEGKMTYANKNVYEGGWEAGKQSGKGIMTYADGTVYDGEWSEGAYNGLGKLTYKNGDVYDGAWETGKQSGQGVMIYASGSSYEGAWEAGMPSGQGKMFYVSGDIYSGLWKKGGRSGAGEFYDKVLDRYFQGIWDASALSGDGYVRFGSTPEALTLQGEWIDNSEFRTSFSIAGKSFTGSVLALTGDSLAGPFLKEGKVVWTEDITAEGRWMPEVTLQNCSYTSLAAGKVHYNVEGRVFDGDVKDGKENNGNLTVSIPGQFSFSGEIKDGEPYGIYVGDIKASPFQMSDLSIWDEIQGADIGRIEGAGSICGVFKKRLNPEDEAAEPCFLTVRGLLKDGVPDGEVYMEFASADSLAMTSTWKEGAIVEGKGMLDTVPFTLRTSGEGNNVLVELENGERCNFIWTETFGILQEIRNKINGQRALREKLAADMNGGI